MRLLLGTLSLALLTTAAAPLGVAAAEPNPRRSGFDGRLTVVDPGQSFRGLDAVDRHTAWVTGGSLTAGGAGKVYRTTDGGETWQDVSPPGTAGLSLRDVEARDADTAVVLSIGEGAASRIWRTTDGGATWTETFRNAEPTAFYNCLDFYADGRHGLAVSDPVDGRFRIVATDDGGQSWQVLPDAGMPDSTGEANFSASGDCLVIEGRSAWFGSGGSQARVFRSTDRGLTWKATDSKLYADDAAGVFALAFRTERCGVAVGGDFSDADDGRDAAAYTRDGRRWKGGDVAHLGEDAAWLSRRAVLMTGESGDVAGTSISTDAGRSWDQVSSTGFHTLDCVRDACWAAGGGGRVGVLSR